MRLKTITNLLGLLAISCGPLASIAYSSPKLQSEFDALVFGNIDFSRTIINMTPQNHDPSSDETPTLTLDQYEKGFAVAHGLAFDLGVGPGSSFYFSAAKENYHEYIRRESSLDGITRELFFGANFKSTNARAVTVHRATGKGFYSALEVQTKMDIEPVNDYMGKYNWYYAADHGSSKQLTRALQRLVKATSLQDELLVNIPDAKKLKFTAMTFDLDLPRTFVDYLLMENHLEQIMDVYGAQAELELEKYFTDNSDPLRLCMTHFTKFDLDNCKARLQFSQKLHVRKMRMALEEMKLSRQSDDFANQEGRKIFVKALADFGNALMSDVFIFKTVYKDAQKCGPKTSFKIIGERLSQYVSNHVWPVDQSCK